MKFTNPKNINIKDFFTIISTIIALFSLIVICIELRETKNARMLNNLIILNQQVYPINKMNEIFEEMYEGGKLLKESGGKFSQVEIENFLGYFEMLGIIEERGYLDLELIDDMFGNDILLIFKNKELAEYINSDPEANWPFLKQISRKIKPLP